MKKLIALLLALTMVLSLAACGNKTAEPTAAPTEGTVAASEPAADENATYTYNTATSVFPTNWNYCTYQTNDDSLIVGPLNGSLYTFDYNEDRTGYVLIPSAATAEPEDVTAEYIGQFGLVEGDTARAHKVTLRDDLKWDDGTPINAHDFVESAKRLLDPKAQNFRADLMYAGSFIVHNAENYLKQGQTLPAENMAVGNYALADLTKNEAGVYCDAEGHEYYIAVGAPLQGHLGGDVLKDYVEKYGDAYFDVSTWEQLVALMDDEGMVPLTDESYALFLPVITGNPAWNEDESYAQNYFVFYNTYADMDFSEVGIFAVSDYELVYVIDQPMAGFELMKSFPDILVKIDLYDSLAKYEDGTFTTTYCTSAETSASWGAYKLTSFQMDKQYTLERNDNYYNLTDDTYQTTHIVVDYVPEASTRLELFLQGKLDVYGLEKEDMATYQLSDYTYWATSPSLFAMAFNPDLEALTNNQAAAGANINKTILTVPEFRMAMSFAMDRAAFCLATSPTNAPALALYSSLHVYDPEAGLTYRATPQAKQVMAEFWGVADDYGDGKMYADIDEAIESITGYNLEMAKELFNTAYDKAVEGGLMDEDDVVEIKIGTPNSTSAFYNAGYEFIVNNYTEAVKGTKLEGKLTFTRDDTLGNGFGEALRNNQVDMLFGVGFSGDPLDPFGFFEVWVSGSWGGTLQYDDSVDYGTVDATVTIDGVDYTTSVLNWYYIMNGQAQTITAADGTTMEYSCGSADNDSETRLDILAAMEKVILLNYNFIPLLDDSGAQLKGQQVNYGYEEYNLMMSFGGYKYYTYNYTDAEWDAYVAENNGMLDYT